MDALDRAIVNRLQDGFPVCERPYEVVAGQLGCDEDELLARLDRLLSDRVLTRFGPCVTPSAWAAGSVWWR
jgi:DNA-binding Lrp family transcriptional regulator